MDASLSTAVNPVSVPSLSPVEPSAGAAPSAMRGADFANLLGHLMDPGRRQDLAASGLQSVPISPQIEVITASEPLPDAASLLAFARGQGLDDLTLKALFGPAATQSAVAGAAVQSAAASAATVASLTLLSESAGPGGPSAWPAAVQIPGVLASSGIPNPDAAALNLQVPIAPAALALDATRPVYVVPHPSEALPVEDTVAEPGTVPAGEDVQIRPAWSMPAAPHADLAGPQTLGSLSGHGAMAVPEFGSSGSPAAGGAHAAPLSPAPVLVGPSVQAPVAGTLAPSSQSAGAGVVPSVAVLGAGPIASQMQALEGSVGDLRWQVSSPGLTAQVEQAGSVDPEAPGTQAPLVEALRLRLVPLEAITQRLAAMSGSGEQTAWALVSGQAASTSLLRLDLREAGLKLAQGPHPGWDLADGPVMDEAAPPATGHPAAETGRSLQASQAPAAGLWSSTAVQRAEQYEQLAQRLGEALGQRLQSQIERGQWKMQMRLDPAQLGRIDLELDMSAGGLDAVFRSDNQLTRDLIAQGLPRLRESLNQSGTAVANVWVQGDSSRQSGGNPTPRRAPEPSGQAVSGETDSQESLLQVTGHRARQGTSAWDVLA